jgi:N-acetylglucosamine-6-phosphate deacetylase
MKIEGRCVFSGENVRLLLADGRIKAREKIDAEKPFPWVAPGFLDIQVNGYRGSDYSGEDFTPDQVARITSDLASSGTTRHFPTLVTGAQAKLERNLALIASALEADPELRSAVPGIHIEGPYISAEDGPRGAHDPAHVRDPDYDEFARWQEAAGGLIRLVTLAAERPGAVEFIRRLTLAGVRVALGHTAADPETIRAAVQAGATLSTHLGNGSHGLIPRLKNYIWEQLAADELMASIITDGFHLPDAVIKTFWRAKGRERIILTSDVAVMGGMPPGRYNWGNIGVEVFTDGHLGVAGTEYLAGAAHLLDHDIPRLIRAAGCSLAEAVDACTRIPARFFNLPGCRDAAPEAALRPGASADLALFEFSPGFDRLKVLSTLRDGRVVYPAPAAGGPL